MKSTGIESSSQVGIQYSRRVILVLAIIITVLVSPSPAFSWGHEGHQVIALIAEHYMTKSALAKASQLLDGKTIDGVTSWADDYRRNHPETGPWHYINIPLADSKIDMAKECPSGDCVIGKTEQFLAVQRNPTGVRSKH